MSVERRVGALEGYHEWPETCSLYWSNTYVTNNWVESTSTIYVPSNFPTRKLNLAVRDTSITNLSIHFRPWNAERDIEINIIVVRESGGITNRYTYVRLETDSVAGIGSYTTPAAYREITFRYDAFIQTWHAVVKNLTGRTYWIDGDGKRVLYPTNFPATVEEWLALHATP